MELNEDTSVNSVNKKEESIHSCDIHSTEEEKQPTIKEDQTKRLNKKLATVATETMEMATVASIEEQSNGTNNIKL